MYSSLDQARNFEDLAEEHDAFILTDDFLNGSTITTTLPGRRRSTKPLWALAWLLSIITTSALTSRYARPSLQQQMQNLEWYSPLWKYIDMHLEHVKVDGEFWWNSSNVWRQDPSPEVDAAWSKLHGGVHNRVLVSKEDWIKSGFDVEKGAKWIGDPTGNTYIAEVNILHVMHCVNVMREAAFLDYYWYVRPIDPSYWTHYYHCLDMVRQEIMCSASLDLAPMYWTDYMPFATIEFSIDRKCRRWDDIMDFVKAHEMSDEDVHRQSTEMTRPEGAPYLKTSEWGWNNTRAFLAPLPAMVSRYFASNLANYIASNCAEWRKLDRNKDWVYVDMGDWGRTHWDGMPEVKPNPKSRKECQEEQQEEAEKAEREDSSNNDVQPALSTTWKASNKRTVKQKDLDSEIELPSPKKPKHTSTKSAKRTIKQQDSDF
ncbi:hypothetical protein CKM354_001236100 [Cercospora kikuchii]|uniref:Cyclochlorotine biosynthesis protein O n=1 Tax=Cercospora kikuchii TaxID=84275 RepID=A0A9P3L1B6_9PEZI|nr:uncharacterized protein CKM354_001236100 [Cercospora kikuchii]GIZ49329.1 hypothetical protein CKM354_001236100 [Cercospora kikuchii]